MMLFVKVSRCCKGHPMHLVSLILMSGLVSLTNLPQDWCVFYLRGHLSKKYIIDFIKSIYRKVNALFCKRYIPCSFYYISKLPHSIFVDKRSYYLGPHDTNGAQNCAPSATSRSTQPARSPRKNGSCSRTKRARLFRLLWMRNFGSRLTRCWKNGVRM